MMADCLRLRAITDLEDGRVEVQVMSGNGKVTAYISEVDNATNDPFLVSSVERNPSTRTATSSPAWPHKDVPSPTFFQRSCLHPPAEGS